MILLDIEGTTTPIAFVTETLFPYARARLRYLRRRTTQRARERGVAGLVPERIELAWKRQFRRIT